MKISVSSYSYLRTGKRLPAIFAAAKAQGFEAMEIADRCLLPFPLKKSYYKRIAKKAADCGIKIIAYSCGANLSCPTNEAAELKKVKNQIDVAAILGAKLMRHDVLSWLKPCDDFFDLLPDIARRTKILTEYGKQKGVVTTVENHGLYLQDIDRLKALYEAVNDDNFKLLGDMGNFFCGDVEPKEAFSALAPCFAYVHAKDFFFKAAGDGNGAGYFKSRGKNLLKGTILGHGIVPIQTCLDCLKDVNYDGFLTIEFEGSEEPLYAISEGKNYLENLLVQIR